MQRRRRPIIVILLEYVVRPAVGDSPGNESAAVLRGNVPTGQVAEHQTGQQEDHTHRAARYHFRFG